MKKMTVKRLFGVSFAVLALLGAAWNAEGATALTVAGLSGVDKDYDGDTSATATGTAVLIGVIGLEDVSLAGTPVYTFASADPGVGITVTTTGYTLDGTAAVNYLLTQPTL